VKFLIGLSLGIVEGHPGSVLKAEIIYTYQPYSTQIKEKEVGIIEKI